LQANRRANPSKLAAFDTVTVTIEEQPVKLTDRQTEGRV